ncbi:Trafficking protein particle complex subunit 5 [Halotydeus destructor]|nr:Trafficking protein particle complex subunit 5 [Halotydeus destructor]
MVQNTASNMDVFQSFSGKAKATPLEKSVTKLKAEVSLSAYALLFSEMVQYCQHRVHTVPELQKRLSDMGAHVGQRMVDILFIRERNTKREIRLINVLMFVKSTVWKALFSKEADNLESATDDETTYYIIESEPIVNKFISVPKDKSSLNCAAFVGGIIEAILAETNFPAKVTVHWHKGTTFMIKFDDSVILRDKGLDSK